MSDHANALEDLPISSSLFLDKTAILYGASGSGKSHVIIDIIYNLRRSIKQIVVVCPTDPTNRTYSGTDGKPGIVQRPLIHYKLTEGLLIKLWQRQEMFAAVHSRANQITVLESLFSKLNLGDVNKVLNKAESVKAETIGNIEDQYVDKAIRKAKITEIEEKFKEFYILVYKRYIAANKKALSQMKLTPDESFALKYLSFNPRMVLVLDDCSADFKKIKSKEAKSVLEKMFFQNRWAYLTVLIAVHDDKLLDSELRKNAYISIFTTPQSAYAYFKRDTNGFPREMLNRVNSISKSVFTGHQKLAFVRQRDEIYRMTAVDRSDTPFIFGAPAILDYCGKIQSDGGISIDKNNDFYEYFCTP